MTLLVVLLCIIAQGYNITNGLLKGFNFTTGLANVYPFLSDKLVTEGNVSGCPTGCKACDKRGCTKCYSGEVRYNPTTKQFACYCLFGQRWAGNFCQLVSLPSCIEAANTTVCGISPSQAAMAASKTALQFNITAFNKNIISYALTDTLDAFFVLLSVNDPNGGISEDGLSLALNWMRGIALTMPEAILNAEDLRLGEVAGQMKAVLGYWREPVANYSGQKILVNNFDFTLEVTNLLTALSRTSWGDFGTALGQLLKKVPASDYLLELPTDSQCPPSWWACVEEEKTLTTLVWFIIKEMGLSSGITNQMVQNIVDESEITYLYEFYNNVAYQNFHGGFNSNDMKIAFISLYNAIKALTDAGSTDSSETSAIAKFKTATQSIVEPRVIRMNGNTTVNGAYIWDDFGDAYFNLTQGYVNMAGVAIGDILIVLNTPRRAVQSGEYNEDVVPSPYATQNARTFLQALLAAYSSKPGSRMLAGRKLDSCTGSLENSLEDSAKTIVLLERGSWLSALYRGTKAVCGYADIVDTCQDSFELPSEIQDMCNVLTNWPDLALDVAEYIFSFANKNLFSGFIKATNIILECVASDVSDFVSDAAEEVGDCISDFLGAFLSGPIMTFSSVALLVVAQL